MLLENGHPLSTCDFFLALKHPVKKSPASKSQNRYPKENNVSDPCSFLGTATFFRQLISASARFVTQKRTLLILLDSLLSTVPSSKCYVTSFWKFLGLLQKREQ